MRQFIGAMCLARDVLEFEMECQNGNNLVINASRRGCIRIIEHALNIPGIYFNNKIPNSNNKEFIDIKGPK